MKLRLFEPWRHSRAPRREARTIAPNAPVGHSWSSSTNVHIFVPAGLLYVKVCKHCNTVCTNTGARNAAPCTLHFFGTSFGRLAQSGPMRLDGECLQLLWPQQHMGHELQFSSMLAAASWCQPPAKILKGLLWTTLVLGLICTMGSLCWNDLKLRTCQMHDLIILSKMSMIDTLYKRGQTSLLTAVPQIHLWNLRNPQWNLLSARRSAWRRGLLAQIHWNLV